MEHVQPQRESESLKFECDFHWRIDEIDLLRFPFIRQTFLAASFAFGRVNYPGNEVGCCLGWARLHPGSPSGMRRRVFWLARHDPALFAHRRDDGPITGLPMEAVDPLALTAGMPGIVTPRCCQRWTREAIKVLKELAPHIEWRHRKRPRLVENWGRR